jgi:hypothetical protein
VITDGTKNPRGRRRKYGNRLDSADECATANREKAQTYSVFLYGKQRNVQAFAQVVMLKTLKCPIRVVWVYRQSRYVALFTTDLSLSRNADAVNNHLNFCMMATTLTWVYADRLQKEPDRRHKIRGRVSFAFSDVRRIIAEVALDPNFQSVCQRPAQTVQNSLIKILLRMVA